VTVPLRSYGEPGTLPKGTRLRAVTKSLLDEGLVACVCEVRSPAGEGTGQWLLVVKAATLCDDVAWERAWREGPLRATAGEAHTDLRAFMDETTAEIVKAPPRARS